MKKVGKMLISKVQMKMMRKLKKARKNPNYNRKKSQFRLILQLSQRLKNQRLQQVLEQVKNSNKDLANKEKMQPLDWISKQLSSLKQEKLNSVMVKCKNLSLNFIWYSIGTRELHYIYKQKFRMPDTREAVLINKLALEYRKIRCMAISGS